MEYFENNLTLYEKNAIIVLRALGLPYAIGWGQGQKVGIVGESGN
jgi:hypothetical protein